MGLHALVILVWIPHPSFVMPKILTADSSEAYSSRGGQCRNPHNLEQHPGGSSSGSAVAVSASMCAFGLATETDGSVSTYTIVQDVSHLMLTSNEPRQVIYPADRNGVVGFKPTVGSTSARGIIPESRNLDVVGSTAKTVADAAIVTSVIMGQTLEDGPGTSSKIYHGSFFTAVNACPQIHRSNRLSLRRTR